MNSEEENALRRKIAAIRAAIRHHRDEKGDDRCWLDDYFIWDFLPDSPGVPTTLPPGDEAMAACRAFYNLRNAPTPDPVPPDAVTDPARWDADLDHMAPAA